MVKALRYLEIVGHHGTRKYSPVARRHSACVVGVPAMAPSCDYLREGCNVIKTSEESDIPWRSEGQVVLVSVMVKDCEFPDV